MSAGNNTRLGIALMIAVSVVFAAQDGISRHLAAEYNVFMVVMIRYWFFAAFVISIASRKAGGLRAAAHTDQPLLQGLRGLLLAAEICVMVTAFTVLGLVESHAVFAAYPLIVAALSGPILGERVGWRRWAAIAVGFAGVLFILRPGRNHPTDRGYHVRHVWPAHAFCRASRQHGHQFFLDRYDGRGRNDGGGPVVLDPDDWVRLGLDGHVMPDRRAWALVAHPLLRGGRSECGTTLCLFPDGLCRGGGHYVF